MRCEQLADDLAGSVDGSAVLDERRHRHIGQCLRCQANLAQHRRILRMLQSMRSERIDPAPALLTELLVALDRALNHVDERRSSRLSGRRAAYLGGLAVATAAGATGALVVASRNRRAS